MSQTTAGARVDVVIVNYHSSDYVQRCVATFDPAWCHSVVVVDNSADCDELARLTELDVPAPLTVLDAGGNVGFGAGVNLGAAHLRDSGADLLWILNPDTLPEQGAAEALIARLDQGCAAAVSPAIVSGDDGDTVWFTGGDVDLKTGAVRHWDYERPFDRRRTTAYFTMFLCGAAPLFRKDAWADLGGFDEKLFLYWEDVELSLRAHDRGLRFEIVPSAVVWHAVGGTSGEHGQSRHFYRYSARNRVAVMRRRRGLRAVFGVPGLIATVRLALHPLRESSGRWSKFRVGLQGLLAGVRGV